jgi:hypothetical protein
MTCLQNFEAPHPLCLDRRLIGGIPNFLAFSPDFYSIVSVAP